MTPTHWALIGCLLVNLVLLWVCSWLMDKWQDAEARLATIRRLYGARREP